MRIWLNDSWRFRPDWKDEYIDRINFDDFEKVRIPHTVKTIPYDYADASDYQMVSTYATVLDLSGHEDEDQYLTFEGAAHRADVYVNGKLVKSHECGYTSFRVNLKGLTENGKARVVVKLDSRESLDQPPFGHVMDYMTYGGLYRDTYIDCRISNHIEDCFVKAYADGTLTLELEYREHFDTNMVRVKIADIDETVKADSNITFRVKNVKEWNIDNPVLYPLEITLLDGKIAVDTFTCNVGFRTITSDRNGIYLNGKRVQIRGLNRHQAYPYVGYAMPERLQRRDADIMKYELGLNSVRTSHYPQSHDFIDECDKIGLLVFTEIPGWQHIGGEHWKDVAVENTRDMVKEWRNHPSIYMWGVRINESDDDHDFYMRTNEAARSLDDTRLIGGVRCVKHSELLEDVYTYNDFSHDGTAKGAEKRSHVTRNRDKAYIITEYDGHMYPTKMTDDEVHRTEHLRRHLRVINDVLEREGTAGSYGWCFADYNTHKDFGAGDQICYHGVLDMFRNPKIAAYAYSSQQDSEPVLEINSTMDIGEHPGGFIRDIMVLSNADSVRLLRNGEVINEFRPSSEYGSLPHPPFMIDDIIGSGMKDHEKYTPWVADRLKSVLLDIQKNGMGHMSLKSLLTMAFLMAFRGMTISEGTEMYEKYIGGWGDADQSWTLEAIKDGKTVKTIDVESFRKLSFRVESDTLELVEGKSWDCASVSIEAVNQKGAHLPYFSDPISLEVSGDIELIGPSIISMKGGWAGFYVRSLRKGSGTVIIRHDGVVVETLDYKVD